MWRVMVLIGAVAMGGCTSAVGGGGGEARPVAGLRTVETQRTMVQSAETMVPYTDVLTYSDDWVALSRRRSEGR